MSFPLPNLPPHSTRRLRRAALCALAACIAGAAPAWASLGGDATSVEADRAHLAARLTTATQAGYTVHTLTLPTGGVTTEYATTSGVVFAIVWHGAGRPNLRQLLGDRFAIMQADNTTTTGRRLHRPMSVNRADFIVQTSGHPGAFSGRALLPQLAPPGFSFSVVQ